MEAFIRRLLPNQVTPSPKSFRTKLLDDPDTGGLELADFLAHTPAKTAATHELKKVPRSSSTSNSSTQSDHAAGVNQAAGLSGSPTASSHSSSYVAPTDKEDSSTAVLASRRCSKAYYLATPNTASLLTDLQHWQGSAADVRLVLGVLLEHASNSWCQEQLQQLLHSSTWSEACQQCKDGWLLGVLVHHYFPSTMDLQQLDAAVSSSSSGSSHAGAPVGPIASAAAATGDGRCNSTQQRPHPLQEMRSASQCNNVKQQPLCSSPAELVLTAAAAAGVQLPADCSYSSVTAADPQQLLELLTAIIIAGEMQHLLEEECGGPLQAAAAAQQQLLLQQLQQESPAVQPLLCAWLTAMLHVQCGDYAQADFIEAGNTTATVQVRNLTRQQHQHNKPGGPDSTQGRLHYSWQSIVDVLLHLQQAQQQRHASVSGRVLVSKHAAPWQDPLKPVGAKFNSHATHGESTPDSDSLYHSRIDCHNSNSGSIHSIAVCSASYSEGQDILQQLRQLGCQMVLLQQDDLQDTHLQSLTTAAAKQQPLQLVLLLRLISSTRHLWLPVIQQQKQQQPNEADPVLAAHAMAPLSLHTHWQHSRTGSSCSERGVTTSDYELPSEEVAPSAEPELSNILQQGEGNQLSAAITDGAPAPHDSWPPELLETAQLWPGDEDDLDDAFTREERTLRCWINSLLHRGRAAGSGAGACSRRGSSTGSSLGGSGGGAPQYAPGTADGAVGDAVGHGGGERCSWQELKTGLSITAAAGSVGSTTATVESAVQAVVTAPATPTISKRTIRIIRSSSDTGAPPQQQQQQQQSNGNAVAVLGSACKFSFSSISSLFGAEIRSGVLLLELLEHLQPGCVDWKLANKLPFKMGAAAQLLALENCQLALRTAQEDLGLPLVSMAPRDVVLGRRKIILSLVYQLMRYHTMQLLERIATTQQQQQSVATLLAAGLGAEGVAAAAAPRVGSPSVTPRAAAAATGRVKIFSSSKKQQRQLAITEQDILDWANSKLQQVQPLCAAANANTAATASAAQGTTEGNVGSMAVVSLGAVQHAVHHTSLAAVQSQRQFEALGPVARPILRSFKDPALASGVVLLQLLYVMDPSAVDMSFVTPGLTPAQRQSNAKYALGVADKMGCSLFLVWEDLVDLQPKMVLVLLASLMYLDQTKLSQQQNPVQEAGTAEPAPSC